MRYTLLRARAGLVSVALATAVVGALAGCDPLDQASGAGTAPTATVPPTPGAASPTPGGSDGGSAAPVDQGASAGAGPASSGTDDAGKGGEVKPCDLLQQAEADRLAGLSLKPPVATADSCTWSAPPDGPTGQVEVYVGDAAKNIYDTDREIGHRFAEIDGLGDEAYQEEDNIFVRQHGVWLAVRLVRTNDPAQNIEPLQQAARAAVGRL